MVRMKVWVWVRARVSSGGAGEVRFRKKKVRSAKLIQPALDSIVAVCSTRSKLTGTRRSPRPYVSHLGCGCSSLCCIDAPWAHFEDLR